MSEQSVSVVEQSKVEDESLDKLRRDVNHLAMQVSLLDEKIRTQVNSRRGLEGPRGERGETGPAGRDGKDAAIRIVQAGGIIAVLDGDKEVATLVAVPGPAGKDGVSIKGDKGDPGVSPKVTEVVELVVAEIEKRLLKK